MCHRHWNTIRSSISSARIDIWSRRLVGWSMRDDMATPLVTDALDMAIATRRPDRVTHRSDPLELGQYTSKAFEARCDQAGIAVPMGRRGDGCDCEENGGVNAVAESFSPPSRPNSWPGPASPPGTRPDPPSSTTSKASTTPHRRHSAIRHHSPTDYEGAPDHPVDNKSRSVQK